jgi:hypothetical protein
MADSTDPDTVLDEARELASQGKYAEALERRLWFHEHALEHEPAMYGVRLSYALSEWVELGKVYPPALEKLRAVRDADEAELAGGGGSRELFHDVTAINGCLDETHRTVEVFRLLDAGRPELASECYDAAEEALVAGREFTLCLRHTPDLAARFQEIDEQRERGHQIAVEYPSLRSERHREAIETIFAHSALRLVEILEGTGRAADAAHIRALALAASDSPEVRLAMGATV